MVIDGCFFPFILFLKVYLSAICFPLVIFTNMVCLSSLSFRIILGQVSNRSQAVEH